MRRAAKFLLVLALSVGQLAWIVCWMIIIFLMGYDGGGFAGGMLSPAVAVVIVLAPLLIAALGWLLFRPARKPPMARPRIPLRYRKARATPKGAPHVQG